jgi:hypothetical protein
MMLTKLRRIEDTGRYRLVVAEQVCKSPKHARAEIILSIWAKYIFSRTKQSVC